MPLEIVTVPWTPERWISFRKKIRTAIVMTSHYRLIASMKHGADGGRSRFLKLGVGFRPPGCGEVLHKMEYRAGDLHYFFTNLAGASSA
jgi:hypothetical protein